MSNQEKASRSHWIEWCALITSITAVTLSAYQAYTLKEHNYISVEPRVNSYLSLKDDYQMIIFNNGLGPAYIDKITFYENGKEIDGNILHALAKQGVPPYCATAGTPRPNDSLKTGEEIVLVDIHDNKECTTSRLIFTTLQPPNTNFDYQIDFSSIYGKKFSYRYSLNKQESIPN
ncbi:hypothetical protein ACV34O_03285 [Pseudomonas aeruginosa]|uniref:hypothetical protein n=1 Tax=Pseudomonas TaxID=286 RepID=UPI0013A5A697|nr:MULTISPECIES: hypothetical protein [Pseudomonas]MDG3697053.1 hypothetical protein [Pseudomonas aeruginosa]MDU0791156.1 hypothetical protein [Pseudomonas aeruginosa]